MRIHFISTRALDTTSYTSLIKPDDQALAIQMQHDSNLYNRWNAAQLFFIREFFRLYHHETENDLELNPLFLHALKQNLQSPPDDLEFLVELFEFPSEKFLATLFERIAVEKIHFARNRVLELIASTLEQKFLSHYQKLATDTLYVFDLESVGKRAMKNLCLEYLMFLEKEEYIELCYKQYEKADNMTDRIAALHYLVEYDSDLTKRALEHFYQHYKTDPLVIDKWFSVQACADKDETFTHVKKLTQHPDFNIKNPNRFRSLVTAFATHNPFHFHQKDGSGYQFLADYIIELNQINPQIAARAAEPLIHWRKYDKIRSTLMHNQLERIMNHPGLMSDVYEVVSKALVEIK